jgi:taurine dioxygenase
MAATQTTFAVTPLGGPLGAEVRGVNLGQADEADVAALRQVLARHLVLVFPNQQMTDDQLVAVSQRFGPIDPPGPNPYGEPFHKTHAEINIISNIVGGCKPLGNLGAGEAVWPADMTYQDNPPAAAILYALEVPAGQGDTYFANMYAAYDSLSEAMKAAISGKVAIHDASHNSAGMRRQGYAAIADVRDTPGARHPIVRADPRSGRQALFLGRRPRSYVVGLPVGESEDLLDRLWDHVAKPEFHMRHRWQVGYALMWSNLEVLHRRDAFDPDVRRRMHRTQITSLAV